MTDLERVAIPSIWLNYNLPENKENRKGLGERQQGQSGYQTDHSQSETDDPGQGLKRWEKNNRPSGGPKGEGETANGSRPCRFVKDGGECAHLLQCYSARSHPSPAGPVDIARCVQQSMSAKSLSAASASDSGAIPSTGAKPTIQD
jgi:hypothetical protein